MTPERNTRALGPRSVMASLLLRSDPPRMSGARLVQWCGLFGIAEGTARTALSRMVDRGELRADNGTYALAGRVGSRRPTQDFSIAPVLTDWSGSWRIGVVEHPARTAADRAALRDVMRRLRFGELREGSWARPDNLGAGAADPASWEVADAQCAWWNGRPDGAEDELVDRLFAPAEWSAVAHELGKDLAAATRALNGGEDTALAHAFVAGAAVVAHLRADPLLPRELCPRSWPGDRLRAAYAQYEAEFSAAVQAWFRAR
jgi:phenylacetic acid degradation operon negative regulatory protein